jgi:hypothetical protein
MWRDIDANPRQAKHYLIAQQRHKIVQSAH